MKKISSSILAAATLLSFGAGTCFALTANSNYTITTSKLKSDGKLATIETKPAVTDADGKLTFTLTTLPTNAEVNFIAFTIKDAAGTIVRQGVAPAPPDGDVNQLGINDLATVQAATFLKAAELAGTDDPVLAAYLLTLLRSPDLQAGDLLKLASLGQGAIKGQGGFEDYLLGNGVSDAKLAALKSCLVYNPDSTKATLRDFTKGYYTAVQSGSTATETSETQKAGGLMADVFMNAAACADVELEQITNAHEAAGAAADATGLFSGPGGISTNLRDSIDQSMSTFNRKISMVKMVTDYSNALNTLQASGTQVSTFISAAQAMAVSTAGVDAQYGDFFRDPAAYLAAHPGTDAQTVQQAINTIFQNAWTTFQNAIASSNADIAALKATITSAFPGIMLPPDFGTNYIGPQTQVNWPIQQVVMVNWMLNLIQGGGSISYTRDTTPIPPMMQQWLGSCSNTQYWDQQSCTGHGGTWTSQRSTFDTPSTAFNAYLAMQQDVNIVDMARSSIWDNNNQPTQQQRMQAASDFMTRLGVIEGKIVATKAGGASASSAEKKAIIKLMLQPNAN
ncbi:hypothetical protein KP005_04090 [Geomonas nitrogeniifigens]|uniref:Uncharacterized protein n=1 Tax=Geomonas diazotrophica TaxID=2843197 RepID=A0ABX8JSU0_9BACT|nr:hypothetical protein [Geomonas nitrogeniifigens]QWV98475.1 hypothetical protein KP005_04090 [Geomonas nitrogeniifigens]